MTSALYVILRALINVLFILVSVYLAIKLNTKYLWFMTVPIVSHLTGLTIEKNNTEEKEDE